MYNSPYSSSYGGGGMYGGNSYYGGYNSMYGGGYSPYNRFGMQQPNGMPGTLANGAQPAFHVFESLVSGFSHITHLLESMFHATHNSFYAIVGVVEQFGHVRQGLGRVIGAFAIWRVFGKLWRAIMERLGRKKVTDAVSQAMITSREFEEFQRGIVSVSTPKSVAKKSNSFSGGSSFIAVVALLVGIPWLISKIANLMTTTSASHAPSPTPDPSLTSTTNGKLNVNEIEFARALYDFQARDGNELNLSKGDLVAILDRRDPWTGAETGWWRGRLRDGRMGMFPANYVEILERSKPAASPSSNATASLVSEFQDQQVHGNPY